MPLHSQGVRCERKKTWEETKKLFDDPYLAPDMKQQALAAYASIGDENPAAEEYIDEYFEDGKIPALGAHNPEFFLLIRSMRMRRSK